MLILEIGLADLVYIKAYVLHTLSSVTVPLTGLAFTPQCSYMDKRTLLQNRNKVQNIFFCPFFFSDVQLYLIVMSEDNANLALNSSVQCSPLQVATVLVWCCYHHVMPG